MITVFPVIMTTDTRATQQRLQDQGFALVTEHPDGRWFELRGASGAVAVHANQDREWVDLSFMTDDADGTLATLKESGYDDAHVWDEAFGRVIGVTTPEGELLWINIDQDDFYGYEHRPADSPTAEVTVDLTTPHPAEWAKLLSCLGAQQSDGVFDFPGRGGRVVVTEGPEHTATVRIATPDR